MDSRSFFIFSYLCTRQIIILIHKQFQYWWSMCLLHSLFWVLLTNSLSSQSMFLERHTVCVNYIVVLITKPLSAHCFQLHSFIHSFHSINFVPTCAIQLWPIHYLMYMYVVRYTLSLPYVGKVQVSIECLSSSSIIPYTSSHFMLYP